MLCRGLSEKHRWYSRKYKFDPNQRSEIQVTSNTELMPIKVLLPFNKVQFEQGQTTSFFAFVEVHTGKQMLLRANDDKHIIDWIDTCKKLHFQSHQCEKRNGY